MDMVVLVVVVGGGGVVVVEWYLRLFNVKNFIVFFDVIIGSLFVGCIKMEFFVDIVFKIVENFRCSI